MPPVAENSFPLLSVKEAADYLGMSRDWVYERMKSLIPHDKIGGALRFRKEDIDRYIASQTVAPLNTKDIRSPISLRELIREPRSLCCFLLGSSTVIVSRSATLMTFPPVWVSPFASQGRAVHTCEPEISQSVRFYEKRGFGEKPKYRRYELALLRQGFGGHPSRMACHPKLRSLGFAVATSSER